MTRWELRQTVLQPPKITYPQRHVWLMIIVSLTPGFSMAMLLLVTIVSLYGASATSVLRGCRGVVSLDEDSFKKITNKFTTLVKFDKMNRKCNALLLALMLDSRP